MWFEAGKETTMTVDYLVDGEFVTPDSAGYTVRAHDGTVLDLGAMPASSNSEMLSISAGSNTISALWENRYVQFEFVYEGRTYRQQMAYQLSDFLPIVCSPDDVRALLGLNVQELPDKDVDLYQGYFSLVDLYGDRISDALTETGARNSAVNQAIAVKAALQVVDSLPLRTLITVRSEDASAARSRSIDFDAIGQSLLSKLSPLVDAARNTTVSTPVIFDFSAPTDAITG